MTKHTVFYAGLETQTLHLFAEDGFFDVVGCGEIEYLCSKTPNPFNLPLKYLYYLQKTNSSQTMILKFFIRLIAAITTIGATSYYKKYAKHIFYISKKNIRVYKVTYDILYSLTPELLIVNVWDMLAGNILKIPRRGTINVHPSKLPQYRGAVPTLMTLKNNDRETAVSYMILSPEMDKGGIIFQQRIAIEPNETALSLESKIYQAIKSTFLNKIKEFLSGKITPETQDENSASYTPKHEAYRLIDGTKETARDIDNKVTLYPFLEPDTLCYVYHNNKKVYLKKVRTCKKSDGNSVTHLNWISLVIETTTTPLYAIFFLDIDFYTSVNLLKKKILN